MKLTNTILKSIFLLTCILILLISFSSLVFGNFIDNTNSTIVSVNTSNPSSFYTSTLFLMVRSILELLYFISGIAVFAVIIININQVKLSKQDLEYTKQSVAAALENVSLFKEDTRIRIKRESATTTAQLCDNFANEIIPYITKFSDYAKSISIPKFKSSDLDFQLSNDVKTYISSVNKIFNNNKSLSKDEFLDWVSNVANKLEGFSIYLTKGICDDDIAFNPLSSVFIEVIKNYLYPFIALTNSDDNRAYNNLIELYKIWNVRIEKCNLELKCGEMTLEADKLTKMINGINDSKITPIGLK